MGKSQEMSLFGDKNSVPSFAPEDANLGNENVDSSALATPQIKLLQALSPELREYRDKGADVGKLFNNVTKQCLDSIVCVNLYLDTYHTVWKNRDVGGGKQGEFSSEAEALAHIATLDRPGDYSSQETHRHTLVLLDPNTGEGIGPAVVYMKSSQLAVSRAWNTEILSCKGAPRFASIWEFGSQLQRNRRNEEYANYVFNFRGWASTELYSQLKQSYQAITAGKTAQSEAA